ncbi:MAG: hypothetical protein JXR23_07405 [Pontiellaceae bacterium]|nr:hypothetical protein [Pontiellaceae bacterium]
MGKTLLLLLSAIALLGCQTTKNSIYSPEELIDMAEKRAELSASPERIRFYEDMIENKKKELTVCQTEASLYPRGSTEYNQLNSKILEISAEIKTQQKRLDEEKARLARLRENR